MLLDSGRKPEYPERTHAYTERPQVGIEPGTLLLWGDGANHHTTVQPEQDLSPYIPEKADFNHAQDIYS